MVRTQDYKPMALQYNELVDAQTKNPPQYGQQGQVITVDQLQPATDISKSLPQPKIDTTQPDSLVAGVNGSLGSLDAFMKALQPQQTSLDQTQNTIISRINDLLPQTAGRQQALAQEQQNQGIPDLQKQLTDLNNQINIGNAAYTKLAVDAEAKKAALEANSRGLTTNVLTGQQGAVERQAATERAVKAAELGMLAARAQAVSGNINTAIKLSEQAIEARFAPIEDELKIRQAQLEAIQPLLNKQEKQQALRQQLIIDERNRQIADDKERQKTIQNISLEAARFGADGETVARLQNATNVGQALAVATPYLSAEFRQKVEQQKFENQVQLKQLAISGANLALSKARLAFEQEKEQFDREAKRIELGIKAKNEGLAIDPTTGAVQPLQVDTKQQQALAKSNIELISNLTRAKGLNNAVGPSGLTRSKSLFGVPLSWDRATGAEQDFIAGVEQLRSQLNLDTLIEAKKKGATFGALSDQELQVLSNAATKIGQWAIKNKEGKVTGYSANEKDFRKELDKINNFAKLDYIGKGGKPEDVGVQIMPDGTYWTQNSDGQLTQLDI